MRDSLLNWTFVSEDCALTATMHATAPEALQGPWEGILTGSLHVTLEHDGRDSKIPVPAVPG